MRCPRCRTLILVQAAATVAASTIVACPRCPATWIARSGDEPDLAARRAPPMIERGPRTIDGVLAPSRAAGAARGFFGRRAVALVTGTLMTGALVATLAFGLALALSPGVSAGPESTQMEGNR